MRFLLVGGVVFTVDFTVLNGMVMARCGLYWATAAGFLVGLIVNYFLSVIFVFKAAGAFVPFALLGFMGLLFSEFGMYLTVAIVHMPYQLAKFVVAGVVMVWNYLSRRVFVFRKGMGDHC